MADRVHPSSSPASEVLIHIPEKSLNKEQEATLIPKQKDFVYGAPPELPPDHPSYVAAKRRTGGKRRRGRCCCCMISFCATLTVLVVAMGITAGIVWLVLKPKAPEFRVKEAEVREIKMEAKGEGEVRVNTSVRLEVEVENPNKKIGIYYDELGVALKYDGQEIGKGAIAGFYQGHRNLTDITVDIVGTEVALTPSMAASLNASTAEASLGLDAAVRANVRIRVGSWTSKSASVQVDCHLSGLSSSSSSSSIAASCDFKLKSIRIF